MQRANAPFKPIDTLEKASTWLHIKLAMLRKSCWRHRRSKHVRQQPGSNQRYRRVQMHRNRQRHSRIRPQQRNDLLEEAITDVASTGHSSPLDATLQQPWDLSVHSPGRMHLECAGHQTCRRAGLCSICRLMHLRKNPSSLTSVSNGISQVSTLIVADVDCSGH